MERKWNISGQDSTTEVGKGDFLTTLENELGELTQTAGDLVLPVRQRQIYTSRIKELGLLIKALEMGYDFYEIPDHYYIGGIDGFKAGLEFNGLIPKEIIEKFLKARDAKIFHAIVVGSPDISQFRSQPMSRQPLYTYKDPVMVGIVFKPGSGRVSDFIAFMNSNWQQGSYRLGGAQLKGSYPNYTSFLIGSWDLDKDLKFQK